VISPPPAWEDIQGLVASAYAHLDAAAYVLLRIDDARATRAWLGKNAARMTTAAERPGIEELANFRKRGTANVNVAFSFSGLQALLHPLGLAECDSFQRPFVEGISGSEHRRRILGDTGASCPQGWDWGGGNERRVDVLLTVFATEASAVDSTANAILAESGMTVVKKLDALSRMLANDREHFGFVDGISQPILKGTPAAERARDSRHLTELGEFVLGYLDEEKQPTSGPALDGFPAFGRNGSYLVFRQLRQDVKAFWDFVDAQTRTAVGALDSAAAENLAEKMVGRCRDGTPLVPDVSVDNNEFDFKNDRYGFGCPLGSHVRRANPRRSIALARTPEDKPNRHRVLRRTRLYGRKPADLRSDDGEERGLLFLVLNANIERQFEFVNQNWINNSGFAGVQDERDPLVGRRDDGPNLFSVQGGPARVRKGPLEEFVTVKGGEYFFLPGIAALKYLASPNGRAS
jgi:Dyp-type peroxidase family